MTRYVTLYDDNRNINIRISFGTDIGAWITGVNPLNRKLGKELIHKGQNKMRHDRHKMADPKRWVTIIKEFREEHNLMIDEVEE
jgi:hypothetical protein